MELEMTKSDIQKQIIDKVLEHLIALGNDMYYTPTVDLCHKIKEVIGSNELLTLEEKESVLKLKANDIHSILSCSSNCC